MQVNDLSHLSNDHIEREILLTHRQYMIGEAKKHMQDYCHLMMRDTIDPDDTRKSEYQRTGHAKMLCDIVERFESGKSKRIAVVDSSAAW
jgi:hypothetical protein